MAALALPPPDPPDDGMALLSVDLFLVSLGIQFDDPLPDLDDDELLNYFADVEAYDPRVHFPPSLNPVPATPPTADSHSLAVSEPTAALLNPPSKNHELALVALDSSHRANDHSSYFHSLSSSSSAADPHPHPVHESTAALLELDLAPDTIESALPDASAPKTNELAPVAVVSSHLDLDHSSHERPFSAPSSAADYHSLAVSEPNAALLLSSSTKLELAPVAVVSPHRDLDHSSHCRPFSASSSAAVSYSRPALF